MILAALLTLLLPQAALPGPTGETGPLAPAAGAAAVPEALSTAAPAGDPFTPASVFTVGGGIRVVRLPAAGSPLLALRVSVPVDEAQNEAGAGRLLQTLAAQRVQGRAAVLGLLFEAARTPWGIAYTVSGSRSELDELVVLLREALAEPDVPDNDFERWRRILWEEAVRTAETPAARLAGELRVRASPGAPAVDGTPTSLESMTRGTIRDLWARTHRPEAMRVVVSGDVSDDDLGVVSRVLGSPSATPDGAGSRPLPSGVDRSTQVFRHWLGQAFRVAHPTDPRGAVVAMLVADQLEASSAPFESEVQLIQLESMQLLTVLSAAYAGDAPAMRERMASVLADTRSQLSASRVESAALRVRQALLQQARTAHGLVSVVGRHLDATGEPSGALGALRTLEGVSLQSIDAFLAELVRQPPLRAEVRP